MLEMGLGALVDHVAGIERGGGLKEHDPDVFFGDRAVFDEPGNNDEFALFDPFVALAGTLVANPLFAELHAEAAFHYEEHFVFVFVVMPDKFGVGLDELDHLPVEFAGDVRFVVLGNFGKLFLDVDLVHDGPGGKRS